MAVTSGSGIRQNWHPLSGILEFRLGTARGIGPMTVPGAFKNPGKPVSNPVPFVESVRDRVSPGRGRVSRECVPSLRVRRAQPSVPGSPRGVAQR